MDLNISLTIVSHRGVLLGQVYLLLATGVTKELEGFQIIPNNHQLSVKTQNW